MKADIKWLDDPENNDNGKIVDIPYKETAEYVKKVSSAVEIYRKNYFEAEN